MAAFAILAQSLRRPSECLVSALRAKRSERPIPAVHRLVKMLRSLPGLRSFSAIEKSRRRRTGVVRTNLAFSIFDLNGYSLPMVSINTNVPQTTSMAKTEAAPQLSTCGVMRRAASVTLLTPWIFWRSHGVLIQNEARAANMSWLLPFIGGRMRQAPQNGSGADQPHSISPVRTLLPTSNATVIPRTG